MEEQSFEELLNERAKALIHKDSELLQEIESALEKKGAEFLNDEQLNQFLSRTDTPRVMTPYLSSTHTTWITRPDVHIFYNGQTYLVTILTAQPKDTSCNLWQLTDYIKKTSNSAVQAGLLSLVSIVASNFSKVVSFVTAVASAISGFSSSVIVHNAETSAQSQVITTVNFKYVKLRDSTSSASLSHISSACTTIVKTSIPSAIYSSGLLHPTTIDHAVNDEVRGNNYDSQVYPIECYRNGVVVNDIVSNIEVKGLNNQLLRNFYPLRPSFPEQVF